MYKWTLNYFKVIKLDYQYIIKLQNVIRTWNTSRKYSVLVFTVAVDDVTALEMEIPKSTASLQQHWAPATGHLSLVVYFKLLILQKCIKLFVVCASLLLNWCSIISPCHYYDPSFGESSSWTVDIKLSFVATFCLIVGGVPPGKEGTGDTIQGSLAGEVVLSLPASIYLHSSAHNLQRTTWLAHWGLTLEFPRWLNLK